MMNYNCNICGCDPCSCNNGCDNGCKPACNKTYFNLQADPMDKDYWLWEMNCENGRIKLPKIPETCTSLSINYADAKLIYKGECETQEITGSQLGDIINLDDLRDVSATDPDACSMLVFNPGCGTCPCSPDEAMWKKYVIPDAGDCEMEPDDDGYYRVLRKTDCGCITECRMPVSPNGMTTIDYVRDSVPDDPDFPWYYGIYNDKINLHLKDNAPKYFGKYALKVTVNYGVQVIHSSVCENVNWRSLVVPVVEGESIRVTQCASILQNWAMHSATGGVNIPWGSTSLRGSFTFIVPKGKEAYLHHEFRLRSNTSFPDYLTCPRDGERVPDEEAGLNQVKYNASRLNALQVIIEPTSGSSNYTPVVDTERGQLDAANDEYPPITG